MWWNNKTKVANSSGFLPEDYQKELEFVFEGVLLIIVGVAGIFGNCAILVMFSRSVFPSILSKD